MTLLLAPAGCAAKEPNPPAATATVGVTPAETGVATGSPSTVLAATNAFLAMLDDAQKSVVHAVRNKSNLAQWSDQADQSFKRGGLMMETLTDGQKAAVLAILRAGLSTEGYNQVLGITTADSMLATTAQTDLGYGSDHYWIRFLGTPSASAPWTVQFGGHHLAINLTVKGAAMTLAPTFWGAQPASYEIGGVVTEPLAGETRKAFALIDALDDTEQDAALLDTPVKEIVLGAGQDGKAVANQGVRASVFSADEKKLLLDLMTEWIGTINPAAAKAKLTTAAKQVDQTWFAWSGATTIGNPIYYRITSPSYVMEFAHQQGQGANGGGITHIHSIYREVGNDYGAKL